MTTSDLMTEPVTEGTAQTQPVQTVPEFTTQWQSEDLTQWKHWRSERDLTSVVVAGGRGAPVVSLFDFFIGRSVGLNGAVKLFEHDTVRLLADNPANDDPYFVRFADSDTFYVQFSGTSTIVTDFGPLELKPFYAGLIPASVAHRTIGSADCRRLVVHSRERIKLVAALGGHLSHREFTNRPVGGISWEGVTPAPHEIIGPDEALEAAFRWDDPVTRPVWYRRPKQALAGGTTSEHGPRAFRIFDLFPTMTGKHRGDPGPIIITNGEIEMRVYNTEGDQFGFHRGNGQDELWMQFRSVSTNETEYGMVPLAAGEAVNIHSGISHRIHGEKGFLRLNLYSRRSLRLCVDPMQQVTRTTFEATETPMSD